MADSTIYDLSALGARPAAGDRFALVDVSDTTDSADGSSKHCTFAELTEPVFINETGNFQIDPAVHVNGCLVLIDAFVSSGGNWSVTLPEIADQPDEGYTIRIVVEPGLSSGLTIQAAAGAPYVQATGGYAVVTYTGSDNWHVQAYSLDNPYVANVDP